MIYDYIVIGAGASGLAFSALMEKKGYKIALIEAHSLAGGCSSYFEKEGYIFDVGATTLSGFKDNGPLKKLVDELNLNLDIRQIDPGMVSVFPDKKVSFYNDKLIWKKELENAFPNEQSSDLWNEIEKINQKGWNLSRQIQSLPLRTFNDLIKLISPKNLFSITTLPLLFKPMAKLLNKYTLKNKQFVSMINELLFITAQNNIDDTPQLVGSMGLSYPFDTHYVMGGMKSFVQALENKCSNIFYRESVKKIIPSPDFFLISTNKNEYRAKKVVSSLPFWNHYELFDSKINKSFQKNNLSFPIRDCYSAYVIYLTLPLKKRESLYYQVHANKIPNCSGQSFFISLSHPEDLKRSINNRQTATISIHTKTEFWLNLSKDEYKIKKKETEDFIIKKVASTFDLKIEELQNITTGSPSTFLRYTKRFNGLVGGIPHSIRRMPQDYLIDKSPIKNFYMIGDTQFPGQGIGAVVLGAQNLVQHLIFESR